MKDAREMRVWNVRRNFVRGACLLAALALGAAPARAGTVLLVSSDPGVTLYVNTETGEASLVGNPGAVVSQYAISSASGSLVFSAYRSMQAQYDANVPGLENYVLWMDMSDSGAIPPFIWDKCCPLGDPTAEGRIYFDNLVDNTLYLGAIFDVTGVQDLVFSYSYGYVTGETVVGFGQLMGNETYPDPGVDGVSAYGAVVYVPVPEPAAMSLLAVGAVAGLLGKRARQLAPAAARVLVK